MISFKEKQFSCYWEISFSQEQLELICCFWLYIKWRPEMFAFAKSGDAMLYHPSLVSEALEFRAWCDQRPNPELFILHLFALRYLICCGLLKEGAGELNPWGVLGTIQYMRKWNSERLREKVKGQRHWQVIRLTPFAVCLLLSLGGIVWSDKLQESL